MCVCITEYFDGTDDPIVPVNERELPSWFRAQLRDQIRRERATGATGGVTTVAGRVFWWEALSDGRDD